VITVASYYTRADLLAIDFPNLTDFSLSIFVNRTIDIDKLIANIGIFIK